MYICTHRCVCIYIYMYMYACMYVCMYVSMYVCMKVLDEANRPWQASVSSAGYYNILY